MLAKSLSLATIVFLIPIQCVHIKAERTEPLFGDIYNEIGSFSFHYNHQSNGVNKCQREVPARFFQTSLGTPIRGNGSTIHWQRIEVCCDGYKRSLINPDLCVPDCTAVSPNNCRNGFCHAPNQCECFSEFVHNENGDCVHTCPIACEHGRCFLNGTCLCDPGYTLDLETRKFCRPKCLYSCGLHQKCIAPSKCACIEGYKMTQDMGCQPICIPDCGHGKCIGPNKCQCFQGYIKRPMRNVCEAECYINCENGFCESRSNCQCRIGYKYDADTTSCIPDCGDNCSEGICIEPGVCKCFEGYEYTGTDCEPVCERGCGYYSNCLEPGMCGCKLTKQLCRAGFCDRNGHCICPIGMTHFIDRCVELTKLIELIIRQDQKEYFNRQLKRDFDTFIGRQFQFEEVKNQSWYRSVSLGFVKIIKKHRVFFIRIR